MSLVANSFNHFSPSLLAAGLKRLWVLDTDGRRLSHALDVKGQTPVCPIGLAALKCPVLLADGFVYEEGAISKWLAKNTISPCTNLELPHSHWLRLVPFKEAVDDFLSSNNIVEHCQSQTLERAMRSSQMNGDTSQEARIAFLEKCISDSVNELSRLSALLGQADARRSPHTPTAPRPPPPPLPPPPPAPPARRRPPASNSLMRQFMELMRGEVIKHVLNHQLRPRRAAHFSQ